MKTRGREQIPVVPLSEPRWARIERGIFERLDAEEQAAAGGRAKVLDRWRRVFRGGARGRLAVIAAFGIACAAGLTLKLRSSPGTASALRLPFHVTAETIGSHLAIAGADLDVDPHSELSVTSDDAGGVAVLLERGRVACDVTPRKPGAAFVVRAGGVGVRVVGTRFTVTRTDDAVSVDVARGTVEVTADGSVRAVHAGEHWPERIPLAGTDRPPPTVSPEEHTPAAAAPEVPSRPSPATDVVPKPAPSSVSRPKVEGSGAGSSDSNARRREAYESASAREPGDPVAALSVYRALARGTDAWAANALYAAARLLSEQGDGAQARALAEEYIARFPMGPNAADARELAARLDAGSRTP